VTIAFDEPTSREIAALAENIGQTPDQYLDAFARDIHRAVRDRGGVEAIEAANAARRATQTKPEQEAAE